jgi:hypothetical protein
MKEPWEWTEEDVLSLIRNRVGESTTLEYKACDALDMTPGKKKELSKDVSAFANSAGGTIVYGVTENKDTREPEDIDVGYDPRDISAEWLEQVINSNIERRISGIVINTVPLTTTRPSKVLYVVYIPESSLAPHMAADDRFYKRFNFQSVAMKEYEVRNLMRQEHYPSREVVCAWRDTVINPLLYQLWGERNYLATKRWEWDIYKGGLQGLHYIAKSSHSAGNEEEFLELHPHIQVAMREHDDHVAQVYSRCEELYKSIVESDQLRAVYKLAISPESLQQMRVAHPFKLENYKTDEALISALFGDTSEERHLRVLAEYVISDKDDMQVGYRTTAPLWNEHKEKFREISSLPPLLTLKLRADEARELLINATDALIGELKKTRKELARQHGVSVDTPVTDTKYLPSFGLN